MGKIVIGYNEREEARDALALGRILSRATGEELMLLAVFPYDDLMMSDDLRDRYLKEDGERLFGELERDESLETRAVGDHSPARALHDVAEEVSASMVVVGSTHRGALGRVLPGSIGERLLNGAPCPVAVAPRGLAAEPLAGLRRIGVAFDGSCEAQDALGFASRLAGEAGATVRLVGVLEGLGADLPAIRFAELSEIANVDEVDESRRQKLRAALERGLSELPGDLRGGVTLLEGDAVEELTSLAEHQQLDLLISGSRGYGPVRRVLLGSLSTRLLRDARCPVIIVPRSGDDA